MTEPRVYDDDEDPQPEDRSMFALLEDDDPEQYLTDLEIPDGLSDRS